MEHESHPHHHPHGTGMRWLDITLGVAATVVSLVSLWLGLHSAHSMEKLVAANSFPYLELSRSMGTNTPMPGANRDRRAVSYMLVNNGVGPARVEWVEFRFKGKPLHNLTELTNACCAGLAGAKTNLDRRGTVDNALIRPGDALRLFTWTESTEPNPAFEAMRPQMNEVSWSACYCSVFDECYRRESSGGKPKPVDQCVRPPVPFQPDFAD